MIKTNAKTRDLGTYYVRVEFQDGTGFITDWHTSGRFTGGGTEHYYPLTAKWAGPLYENEEDLFQNIEFMFTEGNYSCDCNLKSFLDRANNASKYEFNKFECGDTMKIKSVTAIRPDCTVKLLYANTIA